METNKIPTAEEFCLQHNIKALEMQSILSYVMIDFAKLHVQEALKQASEKAYVDWDGAGASSDAYVNKESILNSYDLNNIK